ncbi:MAG TPA: hypothetical protein PLK90_04120 [Clostridiales bacterium]|nr:hypothetical protein [Clostridiales bacterium]HQP69567.1 hypothetical protein [Clostridiales bacterium]
MKRTSLPIIIFSVILILNCSKKDYSVEEKDGVKYIKNTGIATGIYKPEAKFLFEITGPSGLNVPDSMKGFGAVIDIVCDEFDNFYFLDALHATIKKYNKSGEFERYFPEQSGNALESFEKPNQIILLQDTLVVFDMGPGKYVYYLTSGTFINAQLQMMGGNRPSYLNSDGKTITTAFIPGTAKIDSVEYFINDLCILDGKMKPEKIIMKIREPYDINFFLPNIMTSYSVKNDLISIAEAKGTDYRIHVFNSRGNRKYVIEKDCNKVEYNNYEKNLLNDFITSSGFQGIDTSKVYYKKPVNSIEIDKKNRIWVMPSMIRTQANQDSFYIDIFQEGIFINRTVLDFVSGDETYKLRGNRLFVIAKDGRSVRVYDYE